MKKQTLIILVAILLLSTSYLRLGNEVIAYYDTYYVFSYDSLTRTIALIVLIVLFVINLRKIRSKQLENNKTTKSFIVPLLCALTLLSGCGSREEVLPKEPATTQELMRNWNEVLERELTEPSSLWIPFSPKVNVDSLAKAWNDRSDIK